MQLRLLGLILLGSLLLPIQTLAQNSCESAIETFCGSPNAVLINAGIGSDNNNYCGFANSGNEYFLSFTPTATGEYTGQLLDNGELNPVDIRYKSASSGCNTADWICATSGPITGGMSTNNLLLNQGTTYIICIDVSSSSDNFFGSFQFDCVVAPPGNDLFENAAFLGCESTVTGTLHGATLDLVSNPFLTSPNNNGVWYVFEGNDNLTTLTTCSNYTNFDTQISVYIGDSCIAANDDDPTCNDPNSSRVSFQANTGITYHIFIHGFAIETSDFQLTASCSSSCIAPLNDACEGAIHLGTLTNTECINPQTASTFCANQPLTNPNGISGFYTIQDIWYTFQNPTTLLEIQMSAQDNAQIGYALYTGNSCENLFGPLVVDENISSIGGDYFEWITAGENYYLQLFSLPGESGNFDFCLTNATCTQPNNLNVSNISANSAQLNWTNYQTGTTVDVFYTTSPIEIPSNAASIYGVVFPFITLSNLQEFTTYYAYVRNSCGNGDSPWSNPVIFTTSWNTPDCFTSSELTCGVLESIFFEGAGSFTSTACASTPGREFIYSFTASISGTYEIESDNDNFKIYIQEIGSDCNFSNATCAISQGNKHYFHLNSGQSYFILLDATSLNAGLTNFTLNCPSFGEDLENAQFIAGTFYPVCNNISGTLENRYLSLLGGTLRADAYYKFNAVTHGINLKLNANLNNSISNLSLALLDAQGNIIESEVNGIGGNLYINTNQLQVGQTYYIRILENSNASNTDYTLCARHLKNGSCGNNPSFNLNMGNYFSASITSGCTYRFTIDGTSGIANGNTYIKNQSSPYLVLANVFPNLPYDCNYTIDVQNVYSLPTSNGQNEIVVMSSANSCSIHINAQAETVLRYSDRCNVQNKPRVSWIAANNFVLTNIGYRWEFQKLDDQGNSVGQPIVYTTTRSNQYVNLGNVAQLEYDTHYEVSCAPQFSYGTGTLGAAYEMCISPFTGFTDNTYRNSIDTIEESSHLLYPNPASSYFQIELAEEVQNVQLVNSLGKTIQFWKNKQTTYEFNSLATGIYVVRWEDELGQHSEKLFIQR